MKIGAAPQHSPIAADLFNSYRMPFLMRCHYGDFTKGALDTKSVEMHYAPIIACEQVSSLELSGDTFGQVLRGLLRPRIFFYLPGSLEQTLQRDPDGALSHPMGGGTASSRSLLPSCFSFAVAQKYGVAAALLEETLKFFEYSEVCDVKQYWLMYLENIDHEPHGHGLVVADTGPLKLILSAPFACGYQHHGRDGAKVVSVRVRMMLVELQAGHHCICPPAPLDAVAAWWCAPAQSSVASISNRMIRKTSVLLRRILLASCAGHQIRAYWEAWLQGCEKIGLGSYCGCRCAV